MTIRQIDNCIIYFKRELAKRLTARELREYRLHLRVPRRVEALDWFIKEYQKKRKELEG